MTPSDPIIPVLVLTVYCRTLGCLSSAAVRGKCGRDLDRAIRQEGWLPGTGPSWVCPDCIKTMPAIEYTWAMSGDVPFLENSGGPEDVAIEVCGVPMGPNPWWKFWRRLRRKR